MRKSAVKRVTKTLLALVTLFISVPGFSQQDTVFWFAAPEISTSVGDNPIYLRFLTYNNASTVTVSQPANGGFSSITLNIPANDVDSINLTPFLSSIESPGADVVSNNGLKITSSSEITTFYELNATTNKEMFSLKGNKGLGTNFYTPFQKHWDNAVTTPGSFTSIDIVAAENGTTVLITPRTDIVGHPANVSYSITLNEGETYSARDINVSASSNLAGSIVSSDKPISITCFSGALSHSGCSSSMGDQITSADYAGTDFIIHKGNNDSERIYILGTQNGTNLSIDNSNTTSSLINWSETYEYVLSDTINYIHTSKPVYLWHATGSGCNLSGSQVPNLYCAGKYSNSFTRSSSDSLGLILYTRTGFEGMFEINGNSSLINSSSFELVPGTAGEYKVGMIYLSTTDIPLNSYNKVTNSGDIFGMGIINGANGNGSKYTYLSEFNSYPLVDAGNNAVTCANSNLNLSGIIGGGSVTGYWSGTGFGSFLLSSDSLINEYIPSPLDTLVSPIELILTSTGPCPVNKDTIIVTVEPSPIVNASADQTVCADNAIALLDGNISGGATTGEWSSLGTGTFTPNTSTLNTSYIPSPTDTLNGAVTLVLTATGFGSCNVETDTMVITITGAPTVEAGVDTIWVCSNNANVALSGSVSGPTTSGKWTTTGNGLFSPDNLLLITNYQPSPSDIISGEITLYLESTNNGTCSGAMDSVKVIFTESPVADAGINIIACVNENSVELQGAISGPTTTGIWSGGSGNYTSSETDLSASYSPTAAEILSGNLVLTLTSTNNNTCNSESDFLQIDFVAAPFSNFSATDVCLNEATDFNDASLPGYGTITNWEWDFDDTFTSSLQNYSHTYNSYGIFDVQLIVTTNVGCSDTVLIPVTVHELPVAGFTFEVSCTGSDVEISFIDASTTDLDSINTYVYDFGGQGSGSSNANPTQNFIGSDDFEITQIVTTYNGCIDSVVSIITIPERPQAGFYYNTTNGLNIGAEFDFIDTSFNAIDYFWDFGEGSTSNLQDPSNTYWVNGAYIVTQHVTGAFGCTDSTSILIKINTVTTEISTLIPNAISPNGDGKNDVWKLNFINLLYPDAAVQIFNRWGQQIFTSIGYQTPWDGTFDMELVPDGTYYYVINLNQESNPEPFTGTILVLKSVNK